MSLAEETRWMDATSHAELVAKGEVTPLELTEAAIERIEQLDGPINAVIMRWFDHARDVAASPDLPDGPFRGVPFLLKDLWASYAGQALTNGNVALRDAMPVSDADTTIVSRFRAAGLVTLGRTNSPELGSLPVTEPVAYGPTRNPWNTDRVPGGSSGGAAAAVTAGMVPVAHASDGGGSIRIPASCCGLIGLKTSQGRITVGPARTESGLGVELCVSRTVRDTARLLDAVHGPGVGDTVIAPAPARRYADEVVADPGRLRIGLLDHHPRGQFLHDDCVTAVRSAASLLEGLGHHVEHGFPPRSRTGRSPGGSSRSGRRTWRSGSRPTAKRSVASSPRPRSSPSTGPKRSTPATCRASTSRRRSLPPRTSGAPSSSGGPTASTCC